MEAVVALEFPFTPILRKFLQCVCVVHDLICATHTYICNHLSRTSVMDWCPTLSHFHFTFPLTETVVREGQKEEGEWGLRARLSTNKELQAVGPIFMSEEGDVCQMLGNTDVMSFN